MKAKFLIILSLIAAACSCTRKESHHSQGPPGFDEIVEVSHSVQLQLPDTLKFNERMRIRTDAKSRLYVHLFPSYLIGVFDSVGQMTEVIGRQGFGHGELRKILDFSVTAEGKIYVLDGLTEDISLFDLDRGWLFTFPAPTAQIMSFDVFQNNLVFFRRHLGSERSPHLVVAQLGENGQLVKSTKNYLESGEESIRTHMLESRALATNENGVTVFAYLAARVIYVLSADHSLYEIELHAPEYRISETKRLADEYRNQKVKGLGEEIFNNSRVLSTGFISPDHFLVSFATGRSAETRFYSQLYCLSTRTPFSKAYLTERPLFYLGNYVFGTWGKAPSSPRVEMNTRLNITLYKFRTFSHDTSKSR